MSGWAMFWLLVIVYLLVDTAVFLQGYDTFFWQHRTEAELQAQKKKLGLE